MNKIVFVCLGNICRSPMAEFVMKELDQEKSCISKVARRLHGSMEIQFIKEPKRF